MTASGLQQLIGDELAREAPEAVQALAAALAARAHGAAAAVLYYGSTLRSESLEGLLDFYVLVDDVGAWPGPLPARWANRLLPPNVGYIESVQQDMPLRAKYAVLSTAQFARRLRKTSLDTTVWARFCQPALCVWARAPSDRDLVTQQVCAAVTTAASWAAELGPESGTAEMFWRALFSHTYAAEVRVENAARAQDIVGKHASRYAAVTPLAWQEAAIPFVADADCLRPALAPASIARARRGWAWRKRLGRPLNILRLLKAAFTFDGAMDYVVWKIERHRGVHIEVTAWQRRFPLLAAPGLYWQLRRRGILR